MLNIKEIALKIANEYDEGEIYFPYRDDLVNFAEALISAYKAELLKEAGEPVGLVTFVDGECYAELSDTAKLVEFDELFTSDQLAAVILKATGLLEGKIERLKRQSANRLIGLCKGGEDNDELRAQLAAAQEEMNDWRNQAHQSQAAFDRLQDQLAKAEQRVAEYNELIYAVQTKNPDETRHQTALRYIRNAENRPSNTAANGASS